MQESLGKQTFQDFEWLIDISIPGRGHDLNQSYNRLLRRATGELIVSAQDWITIPEDGLQKFWDAHDPHTFITAPVGKVIKIGDDPVWDWRVHKEAIMDWTRWETDWAAAPRSALVAIGGWDEALDGHWSSDNVNVGYRAFRDGYKFSHLPENPVIAVDHDALSPHPFRKDYDPKFNNERMKLFDAGLRLVDGKPEAIL